VTRNGTQPLARPPVLHAVHRWGLPSETFIRDAISEVDALGWTSWVVAQGLDRERGTVPEQRILLPSKPRFLVRGACRLARAVKRDPLRERTAHDYLTALRRAPNGLLHAHFGWTAADCALAARNLSLPFLVSFHGTDLTVLARDPAWSRYFTRLLTRVHGATVVSRFLETKLKGLGYEGPIDLIPSGVRLSAFPFSGGPDSGSAPRLLFVGRLHEGKGVDVLLAAVARIRARGLPATLRVIGDGPLRINLETSEAARTLGGSVHLLGARSHAEVRTELAASDIVVVPSQILPNGLEEGSSVVSKEAQATGIPVVATQVGGIPETFPPELRHELVPPGSDEPLAAQIIRVWEDRDRWPERVARQREWVETEFAWEKIGTRLSGVYDRLLAEHPISRAPGRRRRPV
jgi:glycosyltransferase involved in cell wall biosynthesis